jgi:hypothetical protein
MSDPVISFPGHLRQTMPPEIARLVNAAETAARAWDECRLDELLVALLRPLSPDEEGSRFGPVDWKITLP